MEIVLIATRLVLAVVFLLAGVASLVDPTRSRLAMDSYGAPARLAAPLGLLLGLVELCVAVALMPLPANWDVSIKLLVLLCLTLLCLIRPAAPPRHPRVPRPRVRPQLAS